MPRCNGTASLRSSTVGTTPVKPASYTYAKLPSHVSYQQARNGGASPPPITSPTPTPALNGAVKSTVHVCTRFAPPRDTEGPPLNFEASEGDLQIKVPTQTQGGKMDEEVRKYQFAKVFDTDTTEDAIFSHLWSEAEEKLSGGYNATVLCYGQTGSGKTHTVNNLLPRMTQACFDKIKQIEAAEPGVTFRAEVSFLQIYLDSVYDLAAGSSSAKRGEALQHKNKTMDALPRPSIPVTSTAEALAVVKHGNRWRATNEHALNDKSSRSHTLYFLKLTKYDAFKTPVQSPTLLIVDLAGSERMSRTKASGGVFDEGVAINKALTTLGRVMEGLAKGDRLVPYRENVLTMYLKESLTNSFFALICCCSSDLRDNDETRCTLKFGSVAKTVQITRRQAELVKLRAQHRKDREQYEMEVNELHESYRREAESLERQISESKLSAEKWQQQYAAMKAQFAQQQDYLREAEAQLKAVKDELSAKKSEAELAGSDLLMIQGKYDELLAEVEVETTVRAKAEKRADELSLAMESMSAELRKVKKALDDAKRLEEELRTKERECSQVREKASAAEAELQERQRELFAVRQQMSQVEGETEALQEREAALLREIATLEEEVAGLRKRVVEAEAAEEAASKRLEEAQRLLEEARGKANDLTRKVDEMQNRVELEEARRVETEREVDKLQHSLTAEGAKAAQLTKSLLRAQGEKAEYLSEINDKSREISSIQKKLKKTEAENLKALQDAEEYKGKIQDKLTAVERSLDSARRTVHTLQQQKEEEAERARRAEAEAVSKREQVEALEQALAKSEARVREAENLAATCKKKLKEERDVHKNDTAFLQDHIEELEGQHMETETRRKSLQTKYEVLQQQMDAVLEAHEGLNGMLQATEAELELIKTKELLTKENNAGLKRTLSETNKHKANLEASIAMMRKNIAASEEEVLGLRAAMKRLRDDMYHQESELLRARANAHKMSEYTNDMEVSKACEVAKLEDERVYLEQQLIELSEERDEAEERYKETFDKMHRMFQRAESERVSLRQAVGEKNDEIRSLRRKLEEQCSTLDLQVNELTIAKQRQLELEDAVSTREDALAKQAAECKQLQETLNRQRSTMRHEAETMTLEGELEYERKVKDTETRLRESESLLAKMERELRALVEKHEEAVKMSESHRHRCDTAAAECEETMRVLQSLEKRLALEQQQNEAKEKKLAVLDQQYQSVASSEHRLRKDNERLRQANKRMKSGKTVKESDIMKELCAMKVQNQALQRKVRQLTSANNNLVLKHKQEHRRSRDLQMDLFQRTIENREISNRLRSISQQRESEQDRFATKNAQLQDRISAMKKGIADQELNIKILTERIKASEYDRDILRRVLGQQESFGFMKKNTGWSSYTPVQSKPVSRSSSVDFSKDRSPPHSSVRSPVSNLSSSVRSRLPRKARSVSPSSTDRTAQRRSQSRTLQDVPRRAEKSPSRDSVRRSASFSSNPNRNSRKKFSAPPPAPEPSAARSPSEGSWRDSRYSFTSFSESELGSLKFGKPIPVRVYKKGDDSSRGGSETPGSSFRSSIRSMPSRSPSPKALWL